MEMTSKANSAPSFWTVCVVCTSGSPEQYDNPGCLKMNPILKIQAIMKQYLDFLFKTFTFFFKTGESKAREVKIDKPKIIPMIIAVKEKSWENKQDESHSDDSSWCSIFMYGHKIIQTVKESWNWDYNRSDVATNHPSTQEQNWNNVLQQILIISCMSIPVIN